MKAEHKLTMNIVEALHHEVRLTIIDVLKEGPQSVTQLCHQCKCDENEMLEHITVLRNAGLVLPMAEQKLSLSPFGMYGAREHLKQVLATTNEAGCCDGCKGCQ